MMLVAGLLLNGVTPQSAFSIEPGLLDRAYRGIRAEAVRLAGEPGDIPARVRVLKEIYLDSGGDHAFPLIASHGALWAYGYFDRGGKIAELIGYRYFYDPAERARRQAMLSEFMTAFKATNRQVFIDTYTNYVFSRDYGHERGADRYIQGELLSRLNHMHQLHSLGRHLLPHEKRELFITALRFEQENTVAAAVETAVANFDCPIMKGLALKPVVQFAYFPSTEFFVFNDFGNKSERIERAIASYDLAVAAGWDRVLSSMGDYQVPGVW